MTQAAQETWRAPTRDVALDDQPFTVRRMRLRQILALTPILQARRDLLDVQVDLRDPTALLAKIPALIQSDGAWLIEALAAATDASPETLMESDPAEILDLAAAVLEVNTDFFSLRLAPALARVIRAAWQLKPLATSGPAPSKS